MLGLLSQQEIDAVQVVYFTQEDQRDDALSQLASEKDKEDMSQSEARFLAAMKGRKLLPQQLDAQTMVSKTSIQMLNYQSLMMSQRSVPLLQETFSKPTLLQAPLTDRQMLKRIILYSDTPESEEKKDQGDEEGQINTLE